MVQICVFEDNQYINLFPLTLTRPAYQLRCGIKDILSKILDYIPQDKVVLHARKSLELLLAEQYPKFSINKLLAEDTIFINGRLIASEQVQQALKLNSRQEFMVTYGDSVLIAKVEAKKLKGLKLPNTLTAAFFKEFKLKERIEELPIVSYLWDIVHRNGKEIGIDARGTGLLGRHESDINNATLVNPHGIYVGKNVVLRAGVILDATNGPIFIDSQVEIMHNSVVVGPAYIGHRSVVKIGAKIYGNTSIGPVCKVGGECEAVIMQGYSNKQHEGFLGHAFLGEWVNLGAGTENSDLKNNYHAVDVFLTAKKKINTQSTFVGCFVGDHTKTGIKTMINTGSHFGALCNVFGAGYQPKYIASGTWQNNDAGKQEEYAVEKALETAKIVMQRRGVVLTKAHEKLYQNLFAGIA